MNGIRIRFETKPGKSFASAGVLPRSRGERDDRRGRLVGGLRARGSPRRAASTGTGLKKCIPITRSGRPVDGGERRDRDRRRVRREDRRPAGASRRRAEDRLLHGGVLDDRLDHQVGRRRGPSTARRGRGRRRDRRRPSRRACSRLVSHRREAAVDGAGHRVVERDAPARTRRRPARCRRPSGPRRRRERARTASERQSTTPGAPRPQSLGREPLAEPATRTESTSPRMTMPITDLDRPAAGSSPSRRSGPGRPALQAVACQAPLAGRASTADRDVDPAVTSTSQSVPDGLRTLERHASERRP